MENTFLTEEVNFNSYARVSKLTKMLNKEITYAYDDLAFIGYSEILIKMSDAQQKLFLYIHEDVGENDRAGIVNSFQLKASEIDTPMYYEGTFRLVEKPENREVNIIFNA